MKRRRRFFRDDVLAPWLTLLVILGFWWGGARLMNRAPDVIAASADEDEETVADAPETHAVLSSPRHTLPAPAKASVTTDVIERLEDRHLVVPVQGVEPSSIVSNYDDDRGSGRKHEALDILAPRGTPVLAIEGGRIVKLFTSARGGLTVYQFDPSEEFCYYYAHLDGYAPSLEEGQTVAQGQTIGFVGTTGNAPKDTPHLHFAIFKLGDEKKWWDGTPLDPATVLR
jgi:murein DD-endopeptidase MepM/ murein hydrolase activator NlpD